MTDLTLLLQHGAGNVWLFVPSAILLGALHGLEPGHSKTMMAGFIVAIRGTLGQAVLLGLAATVSHTAVVWLVALGGLYFGANWNAESTEPYFQLGSAAAILIVAAWMMLRTWQHSHGRHQHGHSHGHDHHHDHDGGRTIDTGHGVFTLEIHEHGVSPRFRLYPQSHAAMSVFDGDTLSVAISRPDGRRETFPLKAREGFWEGETAIAEPHEFVARLSIGHGGHKHDFDVEFTEHGHTHALPGYEALDLTAPGYQDPHELAHANDIRRRFAGREVTTGQIVLFGLTGGLVPCPAAITVLLLCLQLKRISLGAGLVLCFSIGLALTLVAAGAIAALGVRHATKRWSGFGQLARKAPYFSGGLISLVGLYVGYQGLHALMN